MAALALDTFTGSGSLENHTPDLGFGAWTKCPTAINAILVNGKLRRNSESGGGGYTTGDVIADEFTVRMQLSRGATFTGAAIFGFVCLASECISGTAPIGLKVRARLVDATNLKVVVETVGLPNAAPETTVIASVAWGTNVTRIIEAEVVQPIVTVRVRALDETLLATGTYDLTPHGVITNQKFGVAYGGGFSSIDTEGDQLEVLGLDKLVQPAGIPSAEAFGGPATAQNKFGTGVGAITGCIDPGYTTVDCGG